MLEHNVPIETARAFKSAANANLARLAELVAARVPHLSPVEAFQFAGLTWAFTTGVGRWPTPSPVITAILREPDFAALSIYFVTAATLALACCSTASPAGPNRA